MDTMNKDITKAKTLYALCVHVDNMIHQAPSKTYCMHGIFVIDANSLNDLSYDKPNAKIY